MNNLLNKNLLQKIKNKSIENLKEEICGLVIESCDSLKFLQCENLAQNKSCNFLIDSNDIIQYDIKYIVHSHILGSSLPSSADKLYCDEILIPFLIYSIRYNTFHVYYNNKVTEYKV